MDDGAAVVSHQVIVQLIAATTTKAVLKVRCELDQNTYPAGIKVPRRRNRGRQSYPSRLPRRMELYCQPKNPPPGAIAPGRA